MILSNIWKKKSIIILSVFSVIVSGTPVFSQTVRNDLNHKLMMGYQGWFLCQGDGSPVNDWRHWFRISTNPSADQLNIDNWPDMSEYSKTYSTNLTYPNHSPSKLFSSYDESTTIIHFKWMKDYNIYGIYLQRFLGEAVNDPRFFEIRNHVLENVIKASQTYERRFALMYDITGVPDDGLYDKLVNDWQYLIDTYDMTNQVGYVKQNGLPVIAIWGMGFTHNEVTAQTAQSVIQYFHSDAPEKYRAYVVGGVPGQWRTLDADSRTDPLWASVYRSMDMISPWTVGRYNKNSVDNWKAQRIVPDLAECGANGIDYMPVIFPGGSWFNQTGRTDSSRINDNPRDGGNLYWRQAYNAVSAGVHFIYVAMFDEVDEGTAMFKLAPNNAGAPAQGTFVTLDEDGYDLSSDWYLRLAGESQKMLDGSLALTGVIPITPIKISVTAVAVLPTAATMAVGGTQQLGATITPANAFNKIVLWQSSNNAVVTVSSTGKLKAIAAGTAIVTATTQDGGFVASCNVTVNTGAAVTGVSVSPTEATMNVHDKLQLTASVLPTEAVNKTVIWSTNKEGIAKVDQTGMVTAVAEGQVMITVKTQENSKAAISRITVVDPSQTPYNGTPFAIPGTIDAADYDNGGEGVAYHDADAGNQGGQYRPDEGVDIETCSEGGYNVGWFNAGEWVEYTVNVPSSGRYDVEVRVATQQNNGAFHIEFGGVNKTGLLAVPNSGGWQTWRMVGKKDLSLNAGKQVMRVYREVNGADFNLNKLTFSRSTNSVTGDTSGYAARFDLFPAFPNPFNATTKISFEIPRTSEVDVTIYDVLGQEIKDLVDRRLEPGFYSEHWDGKNDNGMAIPSGVYFVRMQTDSFVRVRKLMLIK